MPAFKTILVATDFSETSARAVDLAIDLARQYDAQLVITHCFEIPAYVYAGMAQTPVDVLGPIEAFARSELDRAVARAHEQHPGTRGELRSGSPADQIVTAALRERADLVVMGTHGRRGFAHLFLGSVAERVVRTSAVPVLTVPGKKP